MKEKPLPKESPKKEALLARGHSLDTTKFESGRPTILKSENFLRSEIVFGEGEGAKKETLESAVHLDKVIKRVFQVHDHSAKFGSA